MGLRLGNYDLSYVANNLVVNQRAVTLSALQQERTYGDRADLGLDRLQCVGPGRGRGPSERRSCIDTVGLVSAGGVDHDTTATVGSYRG